MGKVAHGLFRVIFIIVSLALGLVGVILFLTLTPIYTTSGSLGGIGAEVGTGFEPFKFIFGGESITYVTMGESTSEGAAVTLAFDYFAFIGLLLGVVALVLALVLYNNKIGMAVSSFLALAACVFGACEGLTFCFVNELTLGAETGLGGLVTASAEILPVGGILFAVCFGVLFVLYLIRTATIKSK